jgi:hypothetical protein
MFPELLAIIHVRPDPDDFLRLAGLVTQDAVLISNPTVSSVLVPEAI